MAQLTELPTPWEQRQTWAQYAAIASLRWRMLVNISRRSDKTGEIVGRIILYVVLFSFAVFLTFAAGATSWALASSGHVGRLWLVFWGIFGLCQFLNINMGQPGTTFDPAQLIRFPLRVPTYVAIRLFFNLLSPANVLAALMSMAAAFGVTLAHPGLLVYAVVACAVFALTNVLFSRMVFAWIDRWLSTRRAREVFTAAIFVCSLGVQYVNITFNPAYGRSHRHAGAMTRQRMDTYLHAYNRARPFLRVLPPNLTAQAIKAGASAKLNDFALNTAGCAAYGALFLLVFAVRMRTEYHGESLSDTAAASLPALRHRPRLHAPALAGNITPTPQSGTFASSTLAIMAKEWTYMRRNTGLLYGLVTPLFLVTLFALRMGRNFTSPWVIPVAIAYSLFGIAPLSYNSFGLEGTGAQIYFMAPVPLQRVFIAKNLLYFAMALLEVIVVIAVMTYVSGLPPLMTLLAVLLWASGSLLLNTSLGNRRSVSAPKKINLGRMAGKQASQTSALISLGILLACVGYGAGVLLLATYFRMPWFPLFCFSALAAAGALVYRRGLRSIESYTLANRDSLFEELGKA